MRFEIKEIDALSCGMAPLVEDEEFDRDEIGSYADYLSTVMVNGVIGYATVIGSGVCIVATGELQQGEAGIADMKAASPVFRQALNMAIERGDGNADFLQAILDDYDEYGICMPMMEPFFEDEADQKDTHRDMSINEFQNMLLDRGFQIGGCVSYLDKHTDRDEMERLQDTFFFKGSALIKTTEYLCDDTPYERNRLAWRGGTVTFNSQYYPFDMHSEIGGNFFPIGKIFASHGLHITDNLFQKLDKVLASNFLCPALILDHGRIETFALGNLVTHKQHDYSGIMQQSLGGSHRGMHGQCEIDRKSFDCFKLSELMSLRENMRHFTPEFRLVLQVVENTLDDQIETEKFHHRDKDWLEQVALPYLSGLQNKDNQSMIWRDVAEAEKSIRAGGTHSFRLNDIVVDEQGRRARVMAYDVEADKCNLLFIDPQNVIFDGWHDAIRLAPRENQTPSLSPNRNQQEHNSYQDVQNIDSLISRATTISEQSNETANRPNMSRDGIEIG